MEADVLLIHFKKRNYKGQANFFLPGYEFFLACVVCNYTEAFLCSTLKKKDLVTWLLNSIFIWFCYHLQDRGHSSSDVFFLDHSNTVLSDLNRLLI